MGKVKRVGAGRSTARSRATNGSAPVASAPREDPAVFDVVCNVEGVLASAMPFGEADGMARDHNRAHRGENPRHRAETILRQ